MKKKISVDLDAPATVLFVLISVILYCLDFFAFKGKLTALFMSSPAADGEFVFTAGKISSYFRLLLYAFGALSWDVLITNLLFILLLGPAMENRYGSVIIGIMMIVSTLFAGVLNACFCKQSLQGCTAIVFMMIFLNSFMSFSKKKIPLSFFLVFILFIVREIFVKNPNGVIGIVIGIAGGLCGSLFAFLASPKAKAERKSESGGLLNKAERLAEIDAESPRFKDKKRKFGRKSEKSEYNKEDDEVIGTLEF